MITDEDDPRMRAAAQDLWMVLNAFRGMTVAEALPRIEELTVAHWSSCRQQGIAFPKLVPLFVPRVGALDLVNRELEGDALRLRVVGFMRRHPRATLDEVREAVTRAFPGFRGGDWDDPEIRALMTGGGEDGDQA